MAELVKIESNQQDREISLDPSGIGVSEEANPAPGRIGNRTGSLLALSDQSGPPKDIPAENGLPLPVMLSGVRARVDTVDTFPWRLICRLAIPGKDNRVRHATGWLAGPRLVLTDGRSVRMEDWVAEIEVHIAGLDMIVCREFSRIDSPEGACLGAIHLPNLLPDEHGFFSASSNDSELPAFLNVAGYIPEFDENEMMQCQVPLQIDTAGSIIPLDPVPDSLLGAPAFTVGSDRIPIALGWATGVSLGLSRLTPALVKIVDYWNGASYGAPKRDRNEMDPERISAENGPQIVYLTGDVNTDPPSETKRIWDTLIFGNPVGCDSSLFYYRNLLPATDVPLVPGADIIEGILSSADERFGKDAVNFFNQLVADILATDDNAFLFGVTNALNWLNLALAYFFPFITKDPQTRKKRISPCKQQDIQSALIKELEGSRANGSDIVVVTHGFGSVILYDTLEKAANAPRVKQVIALASPLAYPSIRQRLGAKEGETLPTPEAVEHWLDISIAADPIAADEPAFPEDSPNYHHLEIATVGSEVLKRDVAEAYLRLPKLKDFLKALLPRSFGSPVGNFVFAKDVADRMSERTIRIPTLIEFERPVQSGEDTLRNRGEEMVQLILDAANPTGRSLNQAELCLDVMKRYIAADLYTDDLKRLQILLGKTASEVKIKRVWQNTEIHGLTIESSKIVQAEAARRTYDAWGEDIHWAVLDSGIDRNHKHFEEFENIIQRWDFTGPNVIVDSAVEKGFRIRTDVPDSDDRDRSGHGTHVAGIISGSGSVPETGRTIHGMAPKTTIHDYRVLNDVGRGRESSIIRALEHIYEVNAASQNLVIHGVNLSLGCHADPSVYGCGHSPICRELRRLWSQGVVVCVAAGNAGMISLQHQGGGRKNVNVNLDISIGDPANLEECIAVGSVHKIRPHTYGISYFSSRGPTPDGRLKPDCVAPGERILSADAGGTHAHYREFSGTSMACPHVSGVIAAFLSRKPEFIGQPDIVKKILLECCIDIDRDRYHQGAGIPNLMAMLSRY